MCKYICTICQKVVYSRNEYIERIMEEFIAHLRWKHGFERPISKNEKLRWIKAFIILDKCNDFYVENVHGIYNGVDPKYIIIED